jgi:hypothetical protein
MPDTRTYADRAEYLKKAVADRRRKIREMALEYGGGKCIICGYNRCRRAMVFHHLDPTKKDFGLSAEGLTRSNCHSEVHDGITQLPEGILVEKRGEFGETLPRKRGQSRAKPKNIS